MAKVCNTQGSECEKFYCTVFIAAADFAAAIQLSIDETQQQTIINIPSGGIPAPHARLDTSHSRDARVSPAAVEVPSIKSIHELKDHLSIGSLFRMKREWLARLVICCQSWILLLVLTIIILILLSSYLSSLSRPVHWSLRFSQ